jgi:O-antigen ligase
MLLFIVLFSVATVLTPRALTERYFALTAGEEPRTGKVDGRMKILKAAAESLPAYWLLGVGNGNYWKKWGIENGFGRRIGDNWSTSGPHNGFLTAWIFWGLPGLTLLCLLCVFVARACPRPDPKSVESTAIFGLLVLGLFWIMFTHSLYLKPLGLILGLLLGAVRRESHRVLVMNSMRRAARIKQRRIRRETLRPAPQNFCARPLVNQGR